MSRMLVFTLHIECLLQLNNAYVCLIYYGETQNGDLTIVLAIAV